MPAVALPQLERPSRAHALRYATELFIHGERVDMHVLSAALGVGRTTLYRWVGDREQLIGEVLGALTDETWLRAAAKARGTGLDRALDTVRCFMQITAAFVPLRDFAQREPQLAMRVLLATDGAVAGRLTAGVAGALEREAPEVFSQLNPTLIDVLVQLGAALEWNPIVIGQEPEIERAIHLIATTISATATRSSH